MQIHNSRPQGPATESQIPTLRGVVPTSSRADPKLKREIFRLQKELNAVILCHNYQNPELYEVADYIGDSLGLSRAAGQTDADIIVFCGVHFMAESAAVLNPDKTVLLPNLEAGCPMADMVTAPALREMKKQYPGVPVVCYVNSTADVKAESDICCTSTNAVEVIRSLPDKRIIMVPDQNLAGYVQSQVPEKEIIAWDGYCPIHHELSSKDLVKLKKEYPNAELLVHPECRTDMLEHADKITSTQGMIDHAKASMSPEFILVTECGMANRLRKEMPDKKFLSVCQICPDMKKIDLLMVKETLETMRHKVSVPEETAEGARRALERMMAVRGRGEK